jgi:hypothetical protein
MRLLRRTNRRRLVGVIERPLIWSAAIYRRFGRNRWAGLKQLRTEKGTSLILGGRNQ